MNNILYFILEDKDIERMVAHEKKSSNIDKFYVDNFGEFGTKEWLDKINFAQLINVQEGVITRVFFSGHGDNFPEFEININGSLKKFVRKGAIEKYKVDQNIKIFTTNSDNIFSNKINSDFILKVEVI